jgi:hypothetical protein
LPIRSRILGTSAMRASIKVKALVSRRGDKDVVRNPDRIR